MPSNSLLSDVRAIFHSQKKLAEAAIAQLSDSQLVAAPAPDCNSVAVTMKHMAGNMRSRWRDFLTTDGEKPDRNRDQEFVDDQPARAEILAAWSEGWSILFDAVDPLTDADLTRVVTIRAEPHTVFQALIRQVSHYGYHVGQIVALARQLVGEDWHSLSIPRGQSAQYNQERMG